MLRLAGEVDAQLAQRALVHAGEYDGGVGLAAAQLLELLERQLGQRIGGGADAQRLQDFVGVQARVAAAQLVDREILKRLYDHLGEQVELLIDAAQRLEGV